MKTNQKLVITLLAAAMMLLGLFGVSSPEASASGDCDPADPNGNTNCTEMICNYFDGETPDCLVFEVCYYGSGQAPTIGDCPESAPIRDTGDLTSAPEPVRPGGIADDLTGGADARDGNGCDPANKNGDTTCTKMICNYFGGDTADCLVFEVCSHHNGGPVTIGACSEGADSDDDKGLTSAPAPSRDGSLQEVEFVGFG